MTPSARAIRDRCPTVAEIKLVVEEPELVNYCCQEHRFYLRQIDGVWLGVFATLQGREYSIYCADWLEAPPPRGMIQ